MRLRSGEEICGGQIYSVKGRLGIFFPNSTQGSGYIFYNKKVEPMLPNLMLEKGDVDNGSARGVESTRAASRSGTVEPGHTAERIIPQTEDQNHSGLERIAQRLHPTSLIEQVGGVHDRSLGIAVLLGDRVERRHALDLGWAGFRGRGHSERRDDESR